MPTSTDLADRRRLAAIVAVAALTVSNVVGNSGIRLVAHVPWSVGVSGGLVALARWSGASLEQLGLGSETVPRSARVGAVAAGLVGAGYGIMALSGAAPDRMQDNRVTALSRREAAWHLFLRIPLSTVVAEEIAFRGVLPVLLDSPRRPRWASGAASTLIFGIWHVLPAWQGSRTNGATGRRAPARAVMVDVGTTTAAGGLLLALRCRTGNLAAPMLAHLAANAIGFVTVRMLGRR